MNIEKYQLALRSDRAEKAYDLEVAKKNTRKGKAKRHSKLKRKVAKTGFGRPWNGDEVWFRVEFAWFDGEEDSNFQEPHWVCCRKFKGKERKMLTGYANENREVAMEDFETLESMTVCMYVANFLCTLNYGEKFDCPVYRQLPPDFDPHVNQAFIYFAPAKYNDTIREPVYLLRINESVCYALDKKIAAFLKNAIAHEP